MVQPLSQLNATRHIETIQPYSPVQVSWCKLEVVVDCLKAVNSHVPSNMGSPSPPLKLVSLKLKTHGDEIMMASLMVRRFVNVDGPQDKWNAKGQLEHFTAITKLRKQPWPPGKV